MSCCYGQSYYPYSPGYPYNYYKGSGYGFALIVVLLVLLLIIGGGYYYYSKYY
ncbi:YjcZ family sporulation protein [Bacillus taeanensis]|uniref:Sporulation protein YjcZ n=1 Tax=Bacillus taeanensis TaxID=273032 RepID=A0A366XZA1_9BACI|nr:YjcZ family sporulation protein [Bacillus taeanensis]RBW70465.1 hypothetical protein DS031_05410 [Bacillus taeanensis]